MRDEPFDGKDMSEDFSSEGAKSSESEESEGNEDSEEDEDDDSAYENGTPKDAGDNIFIYPALKYQLGFTFFDCKY